MSHHSEFKSGRAPKWCFLFLLMTVWLVAATYARAADSELTYLFHEPAKPSARPPLIVLLHGSGSDENDMIGLWPQLPEGFVVVSPRAPFGDPASGYRWYRKGASIDADIRLSCDGISKLVETAVNRFHADPQRVFLAGFSQGAVMVYHAVLGAPGRFRGAAVLSGSLYAFDDRKLSPKADLAHESFFIGHGTADERIPFASGRHAHDVLDRLGVPNAFHSYERMHHEIGDREMQDLNAWLAERGAS
ncbi:phospholipase/carboxylesterase [Hyphomicrobium facile]|uniref:Phospholipase/carboxylesterase n=2 Tax=Hyphomicrobium facile TaxID=51670 RepID=A0A1I7MUF1_9HYPH|nr:phospholipase/carboxylesterase [Hyphomicrobium facile]